MRDNDASEKQTFYKMCKIEPRLSAMRGKAVNALVDGDIDFWHKYEAIKKELHDYVGWGCPDGYPDWMGTSESWDIAYREVLHGLV